MHISAQSSNELNYVSFSFPKKKIMKGRSFLYSAELCRERIIKQNCTRGGVLGSEAEWPEVSVPRIYRTI